MRRGALRLGGASTSASSAERLEVGAVSACAAAGGASTVWLPLAAEASLVRGHWVWKRGSGA